MQKNMESNPLRLLLIALVVSAGVIGIIASSSDIGDGDEVVTNIVEGIITNMIEGVGEEMVNVVLLRPVTLPTGVILTTLEKTTIPPGEIVVSALTDAEGFYRFDEVPVNDTYFLTYTKAGFIDEAYFEVTVEPETFVTLEPVPLLETRFDTTTGIISGTVVNAATGSPLSKVLVRARAGIDNRSGTVLLEDTTSDNGFYSLALLDAGNYTIEAMLSGYQAVYFDALVLDADGDPTTKNETVVGTVALVPDDLAGESFPFAGNVFAAYDAASETGPFPLVGAAVRVREGINTTVGIFTTERFTDTAGFYSISSLSAGQYTLEGELPGFNFSYIDIALGSDLANQNITLMPLVSDGSQQITIVLTWGTTTNLDGLLTQEAPYLVQVPPLNDDTDGFGPETTVLPEAALLKFAPGTRYEYFVKDSSRIFVIAQSAAQVRVYRGNNLIFTFELPLNDPDADVAKDWHVFSIGEVEVEGEGVIIPVNDLIFGSDIRIADTSALEGDVVNQPLDFTVSLSFVSSSDVVMDMVTEDGTATVADNDYQASNFLYSTNGGNTWIDAAGLNGTVVTIPAGSDSILVRVFSIADFQIEPPETFTLGVSRGIFGVVNEFSDTGIGPILGDDLVW